MDTKDYYVIKPTTHNKMLVTYGDELTLTETQARPLLHGGFICADQLPAKRIGELVIEVDSLKAVVTKLQTEVKTSKKGDSK